jgi:hypothetical protein
MATVYDIAAYIDTDEFAYWHARRVGFETLIFYLWRWSTRNGKRLFSERADLLDRGWSRNWQGNPNNLTDREREILDEYFHPDPLEVAELAQVFKNAPTSRVKSDFWGRQTTRREFTNAGQRHTRYSDLGGGEPRLVQSKLPIDD